MKDALKGYLALAGGLTEVTRQKAQAAAKALVAQGEATAGQVTSLADDLVAQSRSNREAVAALVKYEVDRALGLVGLASNDEVSELTARVRTLESSSRDLARAASAASSTSPSGRVPASPATRAPAKPATAPKGPSKAAKASASRAGTRAPAKPGAAKASATRAAKASASKAATRAPANTGTGKAPADKAAPRTPAKAGATKAGSKAAKAPTKKAPAKGATAGPGAAAASPTPKQS